MYDVCIVGAGVSGMIAARECKKNKLNLCILEKNHKSGGIWTRAISQHTCLQIRSSTWNIHGTKLKPSCDYIKASQSQVADWLDRYEKQHDLTPSIRFGVDVKKCLWDVNKQYWNIYCSSDH